MQDSSALLYGGVSSDVIFYVIVAVGAVIFLFFVALGLNVLAMRMMMKGMSSRPRRPHVNVAPKKRDDGGQTNIPPQGHTGGSTMAAR